MLDIKNIDGKTGVILLAILIALVSALTNQTTGNVSKSYIDKGHYYSSVSTCDEVGGEVFIVGDSGREIKGKIVKIESVSDSVSLVSVDGARRAMEPGQEKYIAGLYVTVFATGTEDACLIVRDWQ